MFFKIFLPFRKNRFRKKKTGKTVSSINQKILEFHVEFCYEKMDNS